MNYGIILYILASVLEFVGAFMLLPFLVGLICGETQSIAFLIVAGASLLLGFLGRLKKPKSTVFYAREGFVTVSLSWILLSLVGAVPFVLTGEIPSYVDALFETVSGFTTTGGTILSDVEVLARCTQFWRLFTHWLGGMGVLVLILAILPLSGSYNMHLMRAESTGPTVGKLVPKVKSSARILYGIYIGITLIEILLLLCGGLSLYESSTLTFSTVGTGGFGLLNSSTADYSRYVQTVLLIFMLLCGISFNIYYLFLARKPKEALQSEELRTYLGIIAGSALLIAWNARGHFVSLGESIYHALFQVVSVITTTGFTTYDFNLWPVFSKTILFLLMIVGACAGSTGGGLKVSRLVVLLKSIKSEITQVIHPRSVKKLHMDGRGLSVNVMHSIRMYLVIYVAIYFVSVLLVSVDNFSFETNLSAVMAMFNNIGPGFDMVGPTGNFAAFSVFSKLVLMFDMLAGRLELLPMLVLFSVKTWKK
ncbi:MAG: TrkH family potassium uptake protein [Lachnospiraceae bacterium]|nr:TrkH family potassium uptake protein [Lachnospiraceae bacterium]